MSSVKYSDLVKSLGEAHGTAKPFFESLYARKKEYDEELLNKNIKVMFFGYNLELKNGKTFLEENITLDKDVDESKLRAVLVNQLKVLKTKKRKGSEINVIDLYIALKDFYKKVSVNNIIQVMKNNNGVFSLSTQNYALGIVEQSPDNVIKLDGFEVDLSK